MNVLKNNPDLKLKNELHCTLLFVGSKGLDEPEFRELKGKELDLEITHICWDSKAVGLRVAKSFPCGNLHPHITLGLNQNVSPVYCNQLMANPENEHKLDSNLVIKAIVTRVIN